MMYKYGMRLRPFGIGCQPMDGTDCISRRQAIDALCEECMHGGYDTCSVDCTEVAVLRNLPPVTPPKRVVAKIKVDTEELVERIKEEYQLKQKHGRLIDADKLLQELFTIDEEEWTTPEIRAILENAPNITPTVSEDCIEATPSVTPTERTGEWKKRKDGGATCSRCGVMLGKGQWTNYDGIPDYYCRNCGAKMGGDTE